MLVWLGPGMPFVVSLSNHERPSGSVEILEGLKVSRMDSQMVGEVTTDPTSRGECPLR